MGRSEATSCQDFAASVPATRGLIAAPWTPASLKLYSGGCTTGDAFRAVGELTQNRAARFHLNFVPRQAEEIELAEKRSEFHKVA
jgi:hypothetical protein